MSWWRSLTAWLGRPSQRTPPVIVAIPLSQAYVCARCRFVCDGSRHGACRLCGAPDGVSIVHQFRVLEERIAWHKRLHRNLRASQPANGLPRTTSPHVTRRPEP